jgi:hypothetical protein
MTRVRMKIIGVAALMLVLSSSAGCGNNAAPNVNPQTANLSATGMQAYNANKVVKALDVLRDVAITAEAQNPKLISTANTRKVVLYHEQVVKAIGAVPHGWKAIADQGLADLQKNFTPSEWQQIAPFAALVQAVLVEVQ